MTSPQFVSTPGALKRIREGAGQAEVFINTRLEAAEAEAETRAKEPARSQLHGVPYSLKDHFDTTCLPTTAGSFRFRDRRPKTDSPVHRVFSDAGAILVGKTNLSDMGMAPEATSYVGGSTRNPFDHARTAGGSSGGSAASVALGYAGFDWGTDIGGSVRLPAAFCGVLGMRLSHETWPIKGLFPSVPPNMDWLCGQGPFTHTTDQMRAVLDAAAPVLRIGTGRPFATKGSVLYPPDRGSWPTFQDEVERHVRFAVQGTVRIDDSLPAPSRMLLKYAAIWASHLEELLEVEDALSLPDALGAAISGAVLRGRLGDRRFHPYLAKLGLSILLGRLTFFRSPEKAREGARTIQRQFTDFWNAGEIIVAPVCAYPPPIVGQTLANRHLIANLVAGNMADATALAVPFGSFGGLPRAVQFLGPPGSERTLLSIADRFIESRDRDPSLYTPRPRGANAGNAP